MSWIKNTEDVVEVMKLADGDMVSATDKEGCTSLFRVVNGALVEIPHKELKNDLD